MSSKLFSRFAAAVSATALSALLVCAQPARASDDIETAGNVLKYAMPISAAAITWFHGDREGLAQLGVSYVASVGLAYGLSRVIHEERPDHSDFHSFPSDSEASAMAAAAYLDKRYGWRYGLPAYALAGFVGYSRVEAKKHHWYDVVAGAALGWGFNQLVTTKYDLHGVEVHPLLATDAVGLNLDLKW
jgi:membrane-associated phospholipid phosphatase